MRFLLDANMPRSAASLLRELSHEVEDVRDVLPNGADDATGFIRLNGLRLRVNSTVNGATNLAKLK